MIPTRLVTVTALLAAMCVPCAPALAQPTAPTQIAVMDGDATGAYRAAGVVSAEIPLASATDTTLPKQKLDDMLRAEAKKLGADAVILVTYQLTSPVTPKVAHRASGVAIRYTREQAAAPVAPAPVVPPPIAAPQVAVAPPPTPVAPAAAVPSPPPAPVVVAAAAPPPAIAHATSADQIILTESNLPGRRYMRLGPVSVTVHQKSMFPKQSEMDQTQEALRAAALRMGADAVIETKYVMTNGMMSKAGDTGSGIAVRFE